MIRVALILAAFFLGPGRAAVASQPLRIAFIGDSWFSGVGVAHSCYPRPTMDSSPCDGGASIPDDLARLLSAAAYQNLAVGGSYMYDALEDQATRVDTTSTLVIVMIGYNDENGLGDNKEAWLRWKSCAERCPLAEPRITSRYHAGFTETPPDMAARMTGIVALIRQRAQQAKIALVEPAQTFRIPQYAWTPAQDDAYRWADAYIDGAIASQHDVDVIDLGDSDIYAASNFVPKWQCPNPGVGDCGGHPNERGAQEMANVIASKIR